MNNENKNCTDCLIKFDWNLKTIFMLQQCWSYHSSLLVNEELNGTLTINNDHRTQNHISIDERQRM